MRRRRLDVALGIGVAALALCSLVALRAGADPDPPEVHEPPEAASLWTSKVYVAVEVLVGEDFEVWLTPEGETPEEVTSAFSFASSAPASREIHHAHLEVPLGEHELLVVQHIAATSSTIESEVRSFARVAGPVRELGPIDDAGGGVLGATLQGTLERSGGTAWLLFGETTLSGPLVEPSAQASSTDTDASDGIDLGYFDEPDPIEPPLTLAAAGPGDNDEEDVWLTAPFERGSDVFAYYVRVDRDASPIQQGIGLAKATGGALPFARLSFPAAQPPGGGHFDDDYSLFQATELPRVRGAVLSGSDLLLFGQREGGSGLPEDREIVLARAPLSSAEDRATYQYWTEVAGVRAWRTSATGLVPLFKNASAPSVAWSVDLGRWLAASTQEKGALPPYAVTGSGSAIQLRVADDPRGPWSPPVTVWDLPGLVAGALGTTTQAMHLSGFDAGSLAYLVATDASNPAVPPMPSLYEVDLGDAGLPAGPIAPQITTASGATSANPTQVKGYASPGDTVRLTINGTAQWFSVVAASDGSFQLDAALYDGSNTVQATATRNGLTSPPSASITLTYTNGIDHTVNMSGELNPTTSAVWTPGSGVYTIQGTLTVKEGTYLVLQPGVQLQFQSSSQSLIVKGELRIQGTSASPVKLGPAGVANPLACTTTPGWAGIDVNYASGTGTATIEWAQIGCAARGIEVIGDTATVRDTTIYNSQTYGISVTSGGTATLERVVIDRATNGGSAGIELTQAGAVTVTDCTIRRSVDGIRMVESSPAVTGTLFELNTSGVHVRQNADPELHGNTIKNNTTRGVWVEGTINAAEDPAPTITGNDIHDNSTRNLHVEKFGDTLLRVEATDNWWGSSEPSTIASKISDASDAGLNNPAFARFAPFLGASAFAGGESVPGNYLSGPATGALVPGEPYEVVGKVIVPAGALSSLTIQAGSELRFHAGTVLEAQGLLHVAGTAAAPVQLRSGKATPAIGDWEGIRIVGAGAASSIVEHAVLEHAFIAVRIEDTFATVRDSILRNFGRAADVGAGVWLDGEGGETDPKTTIRGNLLEKPNGGSESEYGIYVWSASPTIEANEIRDTNTGIHIQGMPGAGSAPILPVVLGNVLEENVTGIRIDQHADPVVTGNRVAGNTTGVNVVGLSDVTRDPHPVVRENEIYGNSQKEVLTQAFGSAASTVLDFEHNWWGTTDLAAIALDIQDQSDSATSPVVDFAPPLDGPGGDPLAGQYLAGPTAPGATLTAGTYVVVGGLTVPAGETLVVEGGARLEFLPSSALRVKGTLDVQGGPGNLAAFTAAGALPTAGSWDGLVIESSATATSLDYVRVEYATRGIDIRANGVQVTNSEFGNVPVGGWAIYATLVTSGTIAGNVLDNAPSGDGTGIEVLNGSVTIDANEITGFQRGIWLTQSASLVTANAIEDQSAEGIRIGPSSSPTISSGNLVTGNGGEGIRILGNGTAGNNPNPTIQGNEIRDNDGYELYASTFGSAASATVAATLNYWGTEDTGQIAAGIYDRTDAGNSSGPTVVFTPYLDDDLQPVSGSFLNGTLGADLTIATGTTWDVVGDLTVPASRTLTIEAGATLRFSPSTALRVQGTLDVNGSASQKVRFTSAASSPTQSTWDGIAITGGTSSLDFARVEYADRAVDVRGAAVDIRDSEIVDFGRQQVTVAYVGIYYENATGTIEGNLVEQHGSYLGWPTTGVQLYGAAPTVADNAIHGTTNGLVLQGPSSGAQSVATVTGNTISGNSQRGIDVRSNASPVVSGGNVITGNGTGISVAVAFGETNPARDPDPVVNGNDLGGNTFKDYSVGQFVDGNRPPLDAEGNWWGVATVQGVADRILDAGDGPNSDRVVDFAPFLNGSGGTPVAGSYLAGPLAGGTILTDDAPYQVTGPLRVPAGLTVTVEAGAVLEFANGAAFEVDGTLAVEGTALDPVLLTSLAGAGPGDWKGLVVSDTSTGSSLAHARIEYAATGIHVEGASIDVSDSEIEFFEDYGIYFADGAGGTVDGTLIRQGSDLGTGVFMQASSPTLTGNEIRDNAYGIEIEWGSNPVIEDGNTITSNLYGIRIEGGHIPLAGVHPNPAPVIHGNNIYANRPTGGSVDVNLWVHDFWYPGTTEKVDVQENWWGTSVPADIKATFRLDDQPPTTVDYSGRLDGLDGSPIAGAKFTNTLLNVRHNAQTFRPAFAGTVGVDFDLLASGSVDFIVYHEDDATLSSPVYQTSQTFDAGPQSFTWNGKDSSNQFIDDGAYRYVLKVDGGVAGSYSPFIPDIPQVGNISAGEQTPVFDAWSNQPWKRPVTVSDSSRRLALSIQPEGKPSFLLFDRVCYAPSATPYDVTWNGLDPSGQPVVGNVYLNILDLNRNVTPNHVVIYDVGPKVTGPTSVPAPTIEVKSDPSLVYHSYDQLTKLTYEIDRQATVTVKLLPPGVVDPNAPTAIALLSAQSQSAGEHSVTWRGHDGVDTNAILASAEGPYVFLIQATGASTGKTSTYRGVLTLRK